MHIKYINPMKRETATGPVAAVYDQAAEGLGLVPPPITMLSPAPRLLAAAWALMYEAQVAGRAPRATKEAIAIGVSAANRCPYCVDAHSMYFHAADPRGRPAAAVEEWARATRTPSSPILAAPPYPAEHAVEYVGTALAYHFINRMVSVLLPQTLLPGGPATRRLEARIAGIGLRRAVRRKRAPGTALSLLGEVGPGPAWAGDSPIGRAYAELAAVAGRVGDLLSEHAQGVVAHTVARWDGTHPPMGQAWVEESLGPVTADDRAAARLALLCAVAPYRIAKRDVDAWRTRDAADGDLIRLLAFGAMTAVEHLEGAIAQSTPTR